MMRLLTVSLVLLSSLAVAQVCQPSTFYLIRHAERFQAATGNGNDDAQEILTGEGWVRARALRDKFVAEGLPLDAIFVTVNRYIRSYLTAATVDETFGVEVVRYNFDASDLAAIVASQDPCPQNVLIVNHGAWIENVFDAVGYRGPPVPSNSEFGEFFTFRSARPTMMLSGRYGVDETNGNQQWPNPPRGDICDPENFYVVRHAERFTAAAGNGANDAQEILTPEGFVRARELRNKFVNESLPLDGIFVSQQYIRSLQTAFPTLEEFGVPTARYLAGDMGDLAEQVKRQDPCLENVLIVCHGATIRDVLRAIGYTGDFPATITQFGEFYNVRVDRATGANSLTASRYGSSLSNGNQPWRG